MKQNGFTKYFIKKRKENKYTQEEYAKLFGLKRTNIDSYESGRANVPLELLPKFMKLFDISKQDTFDLLFNSDYKN